MVDNADDEFSISDLSFIKHNEIDFDSFRKFQEELDSRYEALNENREHELRKKNLMKWLKSVPRRWVKASLANHSNKDAVEATKKLLKSGKRSFYIAGNHGSGKTYLAYAILRLYVQKGKLKPSEIKVLTENELLSLANGGFETRQAIEKIFDNKYKAYLFDSAGIKDEYSQKNEMPVITRFIEEVYNRSAILIVTSHLSFELFCDGITSSSVAKMENMVGDSIVLTGEPLS